MSSELNQLIFASALAPHDKPAWKTFNTVLLNALHNGVFAVDETGTAVISNRTAQKRLGIFPGTPAKSTLPSFWPHIGKTLEDNRLRSEIPVQNNGISYLAQVSPIYWKEASIGAICIFYDRTELEKITRKMLSYKELTHEMDTIINSSNDGLWVCDANATVLRINPASERINQVRAADVIGRNMHELVSEGFIDRSITLKVLETGARADLLQTRNGRKLILTGTPVFDENNKPIRVVVNERDVTEIDSLHRELEEQEAIRDQFKNQILEMQIAEIESRKIISRSPSFTRVLQKAMKVCGVDTTVLILGESGVGKGLIADLIHKYSSRTSQPMIKINCGAIPESLVESELFGYEKGAFTGAEKKGKPGQLELADNGILFLDEIGELPPASQVKLLRFLEDGIITRVGGTRGRKIDVRILAATNRDLKAMVDEGDFRLDLYYRLNVIPLRVPSLRERRECILPLARFYIDHFQSKLAMAPGLRLTARASDALQAYDYPGNVREMMNLCERMVVMAEGDRIDLSDLPSSLTRGEESLGWTSPLPEEGKTLRELLEATEKNALMAAMEKHGTQAVAATALGVNQSTIARKLKKHCLA